MMTVAAGAALDALAAFFLAAVVGWSAWWVLVFAAVAAAVLAAVSARSRPATVGLAVSMALVLLFVGFAAGTGVLSG